METNNKKKPINNVFFIIGLAFIPIGIATEMPTFWIIGISFLVIGLVNRRTWCRAKS